MGREFQSRYDGVRTARVKQSSRELVQDALLLQAGSIQLDALAGLSMLSTVLDGLIAQEVRSRRAEGYSWAEIGSSLGVTRQAAHAQFGTKP